MLSFPQQVMAGRLPNRDFLHLYGPGSLWVLAGAYKVFGDYLLTERTVGLIQLMLIGGGIFWLALPWGRKIALACGTIAAIIIIPPTGLTAMAWNGGVGLALVGLAAGCATSRRTETKGSTWRYVASGALGGAALLYRPDMIVAIALGFGCLLWGLDWAARKRVLAGAGAVVSLIVIQLVTAGFGNSFQGMFIDPVFKLRGGRSLPVPPSWGQLDGYLQKAGGLRVANWPLPMPATSNQVFLWFFLTPLAAVVVAATGTWLVRSGRDPLRSRTLMAAGLFAVGLLPQAVQRPDTAHFAWVSCVGLGLLPVAFHVLAEARLADKPRTLRLGASVGVVAFLLIGIFPFFSVRTYVDLVGQSFGHNRFGYPMERDGRTFYYGSQDAATDAQTVIDSLDEHAKPGERLFVGPKDLRKTPYSDAFLYYLFPDLVPATRYIEMDPGMANAPDSGLADDVRSADWLILSDVWSTWDEPNDSRVFGPAEPNQVVRDDFCPVTTTKSFQLLERCDRQTTPS